jgi:hypothetical protein
MSMRPLVSYRRISKLTFIPVAGKCPARYSRCAMRFGAVPVVERYTPQPAPHEESMSRSSHNPDIRLFIVAVGRQTLVRAVLVEENCRLPLEEMFTTEKGEP